jgi:AAA15 family ATPase/GTPase
LSPLKSQQGTKMILKKITIENFKGMKNPVSIELKPITLLFGKNSSGKSSIIQAINYMRQIFVSGELVPDVKNSKEEGIDLGGYKNIVNRQNIEKPIIFDFHLSYPDTMPFIDFVSHNINIGAKHSTTDESKMDGEQLLEHMKQRNPRENPDGMILTDKELPFLAKKIKDVHIRIVLNWETELNYPFIELYQVSTNNELFFQIYRPLLSPESVLLYLYKNSILPEYFLKHVIDISSREEYLENMHIGEVINGETIIGPKKSSKNTRFFEENYLEKRLLFGPEMLFQTTILPNPEEAIISYPSSSVFLDYHHEYGNSDVSFYRHMLSMFITTPIRTLKSIFNNSNHIGPLRELPERNHVSLNPKSFSRWVSGIAAYDVLLDSETAPELIIQVNEWLSSHERFDSGYALNIERYKKLNMESELFEILRTGKDLGKNAKEIADSLENLSEKRSFHITDIAQNINLSIRDIGTGISQILPIVVGVLHLDKNIICIEQPELHIHPAMQAEMADLFIEQLRSSKTRNSRSFVIETHSEHLMLRILRRIRNTKENEGCANNPIFSDDVAVYYLLKDGNVTDAIHIPITEDGDFLLPWPNGFFPERAKELFS